MSGAFTPLGIGVGGVWALWLAIRRQRSTKPDLLAEYEAQHAGTCWCEQVRLEDVTSAEDDL